MMIHALSVALLLVAVVSLPGMAETDGIAKAPTIRPISVGSITRDRHCGPQADDRGRFLLSKRENRVPVASMTVKPNFVRLLNPDEGFEYENVTPLSMLTLKEASFLWGQPSQHDGCHIFALKTVQSVDRPKFDVSLDVQIETQFKNGLLQKYRIASVEIPAPDWIVVIAAPKEKQSKMMNMRDFTKCPPPFPAKDLPIKLDEGQIEGI